VNPLPLTASPEARAEWCKANGLQVGWLLMTVDEMALLKEAISQRDKEIVDLDHEADCLHAQIDKMEQDAIDAAIERDLSEP